MRKICFVRYGRFLLSLKSLRNDGLKTVRKIKNSNLKLSVLNNKGETIPPMVPVKLCDSRGGFINQSLSILEFTLKNVFFLYSALMNH